MTEKIRNLRCWLNWHSTNVLKHYPFWKGRGVLANSKFMRSPNGGKRLLRHTEGVLIYVTENDYISRMIRFFGDFDPCLTKLVKSLVREGDCVIDVGANLGVVALPVANWVGVSGLVLAFEPQKKVHDLLQESVRENSLENIKIFQCALSNHDGMGQVSGHDHSLGTAKLEVDLSSAGLGDACTVSRLDTLNPNIGERKLRLMKIDVEGHEYEVLDGGKNFIDRLQPEYILFESHLDRGDFWQRPEIRLLGNLGYRVHAVERGMFHRPRLRELITKNCNPEGSEFLGIRILKSEVHGIDL